MTKSALRTPAVMACSMAMATLATSPAHAYIGPGAGAGAIAVTLALVVGVVLLVVGLVWYPLKRLLKRRKGGDGNPRPR